MILTRFTVRTTFWPARSYPTLNRAASTMSGNRYPCRFAPLGNVARDTTSIGLEGIVFDMDGTLCMSRAKGEPQNWMFKEMRSALDIPPSVDILDHVHSLAEPHQSEAFAKIRAIERSGMEKQIPQAGLVLLMEYLDRKQIRKGICTRNFDAPVKHLLKTHLPGHITPFSPIITRSFRPPKPSPAGILHIAEMWGVKPGDDGVLPMVMVGDSVDDMASGRAAGALTVLLRSVGKEDLEGDERTDVAIDSLEELIHLLERGLQAPPQR